MNEKRIVKVTFLDHTQVQDLKLEELKKTQPSRCVVYGELVADTPSHIVVLSFYGEDSDKDEEPQNFAMIIIKEAIVSIKELTEKTGET